MNVTLVDAILVTAALLCSMVTGFLFAFAVVVMPGIGSLDDGAFIRAFQVIDRVVQRSQPLFMAMWVGSALAVVAAAGLVLWMPGRVNGPLVFAAALLYLAGVQVPTAAINIPLNNALQKLDAAAMDDAALRRARLAFEPRWNRWNAFRTVCAGLASSLLIVLLLGA